MNVRSILALLAFPGLAVIVGCSSVEAADGADSADVVTGCVPQGLYCGGDKVSGDPTSLFECQGGGAPKLIAKCPAGCSVNSGKNDGCTVAGTPLQQATIAVTNFYRQSGPSRADYKTAISPALQSNLENGNQLPDGAGILGGSAEFVCAQEIPMSVKVDPAVASSDGAMATVVVHMTFPDPIEATAIVRLSDMKIVGWTCGKTKHTLAEAHDLVVKLYGQHGPEGSNITPTPPALAAQLGDGMQWFLAHNDTHADGMTCAQEYPLSIVVDAPSAAGERAIMTVHEHFPDDAPVTVTVDLDELEVSGVGCGDR